MEYLLHCGRYASCVHAGGLSCEQKFVVGQTILLGGIILPFYRRISMNFHIILWNLEDPAMKTKLLL